MPGKPYQSLRRQINRLRRSISAMDRALSGLARAIIRAPATKRRKTAKATGRVMRLTPARRRALKLHGRYLGYIRQLNPRQRAEIRGLRAKKGVRAAIAKARKLAGR